MLSALPDDDLAPLKSKAVKPMDFDLGPSEPTGSASASTPASTPAKTPPPAESRPNVPPPVNLFVKEGESHLVRPPDDTQPASSNAAPPSFMENHTAPLSVTPTELAHVHIDDILRLSQEMRASDIHLTAGLPPMVRLDGRVLPMNFDQATPREVSRLVYDILNSEQLAKFERTKELDFSYSLANVGRFRFNVYRQRGSVGCAMRAIPRSIPSLDQLRLPPIVRELTNRHSGLILVTGPTGSGKSTTIASMIDVINTHHQVHIMTMEDPVEYLHQHKMAMVNQREIGQDTDSFANAIRAVLREDPDVILVGEMRDKETISAALTLAETGHLVFGTLHTRSAPSTVDRIIDVFPPDQQDQIRVQLASSLQAVMAQQLLPKLGGGRCSAVEIMTATSAVRNLIREGKSYQIMSMIETGSQHGMQAMDKVLAELHRVGTVSYEEALLRAIDRDNFIRLSKGN